MSVQEMPWTDRSKELSPPPLPGPAVVGCGEGSPLRQ